jgi:pimeloyl-ACP methyl ester carboxylesterase
MALDVVRLLDHLGIRRAHVVGYSLGAFLTAQLLTLHPDRFLTATLVAGAGLLRWTPELAGEAEQEATEREKECASRTLMYLLAPPNGPTPTEEQINASTAACFADVNQDRFAIAALTRSRRDLVITPAAVAAVTVPTLGIVGSLDPNTPSLEQLKMLRPGLKLVIVDGATHNGERGILGRPELLAALREFISTPRTSSP